MKKFKITVIFILWFFTGFDSMGFASNFRLATWNSLEIGTPGSNGYIAELDIMNRICSDIVCFQEVGSGQDLENFEALAQDVGYLDSSYGETSGTLSGDMRNGVMTDFPIVSSMSWSSAEISGDSQANDITRDIYQVRIQLDSEQNLGILVVHLKAIDGATNRFRRQIEILRLCQVAENFRISHPDDFLIICGDFNEDVNDGPFGLETWSELPSGLPYSFSLGADISFPITYDPFQTLNDHGFVDCYATWEDTDSNDVTYPGYYDSRLDYIFYDPTELILQEDEVYNSTQDNGVDDAPLGNWMPKCSTHPGSSASSTASDHLLVMVTFECFSGIPTETPLPYTATPTPTVTPFATNTPQNSPTATPILTSIFEIQYTTSQTGESPLEGQAITTYGVVTADLSFSGLTCVQDGQGPWQGVAVYDPEGTYLSGQEIHLTGTVQEYYDMTEIADISSTVVLSEDVDLPLCQPLLTNAVAAEQWEGVLVEVTGVTITNPDLGFGEWEINDGSGALIVDNIHSYSFEPIQDLFLYYVRGQALYTYSSFKLQPRFDADIGIAPVQPTNTPTPAPTMTPTHTMIPTSTPSIECVNHGDVNQDGGHTATDAQLAFYFALGIQSPTWQQECNADCDGNGSISAGDAQQIFFSVLGVGSCVDPIST